MHGASIRLLAMFLATLLSMSMLVSPSPLEEEIVDHVDSQTSALTFGSSSGSNFVIDPGVGTNILVNITNNASITDNANVSIVSSSGWNIVWARNSVPSIGDDIEINSNELVWIQFRVDVPYVENGAPLAGSKHTISVKAISEIDGLESFWNFTIEITEVAGISIDSHDEIASIEPGQKILLPVSLRNTGNYLSNLVIQVQPMLDSGLPIEGTIPAQSFTNDGWTVGTFDLYKIENLGANESGIVLIEYAAPYRDSAEIKVRISAYNEDEPMDIQRVNQTVNIERTRGVSIEFDDPNICRTIIPQTNNNSETCHQNLTITNTGNFEDEFVLQVLSNPIWSTVELGTTTISLDKGETANGIDVEIGILNDTLARKTGEVTIGAFISGELIVIEKHEIIVDSVIGWKIESTNTTVENENLTLILTFENTGNDLDGIMVSLDMDVTSNFGLIPPENAITDYSSGNIRFFELRDIEPGDSISFSAFATTPRGLEMNGTAQLEVMVQSIRQPDLNFSYIENIDYLGENYREIESDEEPSVYSELISKGINFLSEWNGLVLTVIVVAVGSILLNRALIKREEDMKRHRAKSTPNPPRERVADWTKKFEQRNNTNPVHIESEIVDAATFVLDHHSREADLKEAASIAFDLIEKKEIPSLSEVLMPKKDVTKKDIVKTADIVPSKTIGKVTDSAESTDTDFDLDL